MVRLLASALISIFVMVAAALMLVEAGETAAPTASAGTAKPADDDVRSFYAADRTVIKRDSTGQFRLTGQVNGEDVRFLVDTGADVVALTIDEAEALGLDVDPSSFQPVIQTASGAGMGASVTLDRLEVGGAEFRDVHALVVEGLDTNLLGQSVLRRLGKVELSGDRMVIQRN
jgi:aspartyl protease family protein